MATARLCLLAKTTIETIDTPTGIRNFLLTSIKWMTARTHFNVNILFQRRAGLNRVTTATACCNFLIRRMNIVLHSENLSTAGAATNLHDRHRSLVEPEPGLSEGPRIIPEC